MRKIIYRLPSNPSNHSLVRPAVPARGTRSGVPPKKIDRRSGIPQKGAQSTAKKIGPPGRGGTGNTANGRAQQTNKDKRASTAPGGNNTSANDTSTNVNEDQKDEEPAEEEKKFEPSSHLEAELVDILGKWSMFVVMRTRTLTMIMFFSRT